MTALQLKLWRQRCELTQIEAARHLGLSPRMYKYYEAGDYEIPQYVALACETLRSRLESY